jgi:hypothetical protein
MQRLAPGMSFTAGTDSTINQPLDEALNASGDMDEDSTSRVNSLISDSAPQQQQHQQPPLLPHQLPLPHQHERRCDGVVATPHPHYPTRITSRRCNISRTTILASTTFILGLIALAIVLYTVARLGQTMSRANDLAVRFLGEAAAIAPFRKYYYVGEVGLTTVSKMQALLEAVVSEGSASALVWSLR